MPTITRLFEAAIAVAMLSVGFTGSGTAFAADATPHHAARTVLHADAAPGPSFRLPARQIELIGTKTGRVTSRCTATSGRGTATR